MSPFDRSQSGDLRRGFPETTGPCFTPQSHQRQYGPADRLRQRRPGVHDAGQRGRLAFHGPRLGIRESNSPANSVADARLRPGRLS